MRSIQTVSGHDDGAPWRSSSIAKELGFGTKHDDALRRSVLTSVIDALVAGRRLTKMDLARSWPGE